MRRLLAVAAAAALVGGACGDAGSDTTDVASGEAPPTVVGSTGGGSQEVTTVAADADECAHVIGATIRERGGRFDVSATVRSSETGWDKYADRWEVRAPDGTILGERVLLHPHEDEQPFTRSLGDIEIPEDVAEVIVVAHDSVLGFCGDEFRVAVPGR